MSLLLFCVSKEALPFVRKAMTLRPSPEASIRTFALAKSHFISEDRDDRRGIVYALGEDEAFESEFFGSSVQHCSNWALELLNPEYSSGLRLEQGNVIVVADERSARDDTVLLRFYNTCLGIEFPEWGVLPREAREHDSWVDFRVDYRGCETIVTAINYITPEMSYPAYYGHKEDFTDENGIFNIDEAEEHALTITDERECEVYQANRGQDRP